MSECEYWNPSDCVGTPECPPRCPRFIDKHGRALSIRGYRVKDRTALEAMYHSYGTAHRAQGLPPIIDRRIGEWLDHLIENGDNVVASGDDRIVGHAVYVSGTGEPELAVFVHPDDHDKGVGTECCKQAIARAAAAGHESLYLSVERTNRRAVAVYKRLGFETVEAKGSEMRMRLALSAPAAQELRLVQ